MLNYIAFYLWLTIATISIVAPVIGVLVDFWLKRSLHYSFLFISKLKPWSWFYKDEGYMHKEDNWMQWALELVIHGVFGLIITPFFIQGVAHYLVFSLILLALIIFLPRYILNKQREDEL